MSFKLSKCETCKFFIKYDKAPWVDCEKYPDNIPEEYYQNIIESKEPIKCQNYIFNPEWNKKGDK